MTAKGRKEGLTDKGSPSQSEHQVKIALNMNISPLMLMTWLAGEANPHQSH